MRKKSCGHRLPHASDWSLKQPGKTHFPQVTAITGTMDISDGERLWPQLSLQSASWPEKQFSLCRRWNGRRDLQKTLELSFSTLGLQPLTARTNLLLPEARGGDSEGVPEHAQSERHHSATLADGSSSSDTSCLPLPQLKWGAIKKQQQRIWSLSSGLWVPKPACQRQALAVRGERDTVQGRRLLCFLVLWLIERVGKTWWTLPPEEKQAPILTSLCQNLREIDLAFPSCLVVYWFGKAASSTDPGSGICMHSSMGNELLSDRFISLLPMPPLFAHGNTLSQHP